MPIASLSDRAIISVRGVDARTFLQSLTTCDVAALGAGETAFGALLSPQGKILFDFLVICVTEESFLLDTAVDTAPALAKRLAMYKLRAQIAVSPTTKQVVAIWGEATLPNGIAFRDPRHPALGSRAVVEAEELPSESADYEEHRIALGIPSGGRDFMWGDAFPHEANMDLLGGISFDKGCYVGQEVVSRMQHRGTTRRRILLATVEGAAPAPGTEIRAGAVLLGTFGTSAAERGLASVRTDRLDDARQSGASVTAGGSSIHLHPMS